MLTAFCLIGLTLLAMYAGYAIGCRIVFNGVELTLRHMGGDAMVARFNEASHEVIEDTKQKINDLRGR